MRIIFYFFVFAHEISKLFCNFVVFAHENRFCQMNNNEIKSIRIKDIAEKCGVSVGTVDRVLYNRGGVKAATKEKVLKTLKEMNYTPNMLAKTLALKKNIKIVTFIPDPEKNEYWKKFHTGVEHALADMKNFNMTVETLTFDMYDEDDFKQKTGKVLELNPSGVVFIPVFKKSAIAFSQKLDELNIPYSFMDTYLQGVNQVAYFGQDAKKSGFVAGKLLKYSLKDKDRVAILKITENDYVSRLIRTRVEGFCEFIHSGTGKKITIDEYLIDLSQDDEPEKTLSGIFQAGNYSAFFIPNSRGFIVADYLAGKNTDKHFIIIGYDLLDKNVRYLKEDYIDFLISQKPEEQSYNAIKSLFDFILMNKKSHKINYTPIDIIIKENIDFYKKPIKPGDI